jgi:hypothetical protein
MVLKKKTLLKRVIKSIRVIEGSLFFIGDGKIYYCLEESFVFEIEFRNIGIRSSISTKSGVIPSMEYGEMSKISL